jgi:two-component system sensor histidine kinase AlgZ
VRKNTRLPNLHNLGIQLRILLIVNLLTVMAAMLLSQRLHDFLPLLAQLSAIVQPILLLSMLILYTLYPLLDKFSYAQGIMMIVLIEMLLTSLELQFLNQLYLFDTPPNFFRILLFTLIITGIVFYYLYLLQRAYSPAIAEARLQALQARIRPHFLFNSINAVLSLIRSQPKRAESALEDMSDLFRVLMSENRDLVPLAQEIALCHQYLDLEKLRLLENAVYHGIEPLPEGGEIVVRIYTKSNELHISISNPFTQKNAHHSGNKMAVKNITERLKLHFDLESSVKTSTQNGRYDVHLRIPTGAH